MKYYKGANKTLEILVEANFKKCIWLATKWGNNLYKVIAVAQVKNGGGLVDKRGNGSMLEERGHIWEIFHGQVDVQKKKRNN